MPGVQLIIVAIAIVLTLGLITCVISHYKMGARSWSEGRSRPHSQPTDLQPLRTSPNAASALYSPSNIQQRQKLEAAAYHDRQVRVQSVKRDIELGLPASVSLPDGEEQPYGSMNTVHLRDFEQENEICRACIRPPPNRTVLQWDRPLRYSSGSVDLIHKPFTSFSLMQTSDVAPLVIHSHSTSSSQCALPSHSATLLPVGCNNASGRLSKVSTTKTGKYEPPPPYSDIVHGKDFGIVTERKHENGV